jgi:hypothetical protein
MVWCPDNYNVTHKYLAKMRRLARYETPFLSFVRMRATTLDWWLDYGNVIPLDTLVGKIPLLLYQGSKYRKSIDLP